MADLLTRVPWSPRLVWCGGWLAAAAWAGVLALVAAPEPHRVWGAIACAGYLGAAGAALWAARGRARPSLSVRVALAGAVAVPLLVLLVSGAAQSEVHVMERAGVLTLRQGHPYLSDPRTVAEVTPYLPGMAVLGLPRAVWGDGGPLPAAAGDARLWCAALFLGCVAAARRAGGGVPGVGGAGSGSVAGRWRGRAGTGRAAVGALVASPVVALPLCVSGVDLPLTGLLLLALVYAARRRPVAAGLALAAACSLKWTAWPAVAVAVALLAHRAGPRAAVRGAATAVAGTALVLLPAAVLAPGPLVRQVFAFPTGRGPWETPAASPLPGRLLAELGPGGWWAAVGLLLACGVGVAASLAVRPPQGLVAAADRLAVGLAAGFLLAPAGRYGYLALPLLLAVLARLVDGTRGPGRATRSHVVRGHVVRSHGVLGHVASGHVARGHVVPSHVAPGSHVVRASGPPRTTPTDPPAT
ncbi:glycosyltransferase 87 family protein [Streptomyces sp. NPDC050585]|uniref:glycosyltransferase 87 family protein n=1 Tax=Streptomyces sp. NPDC050585 TaxID=3365632 RepID=UPI0037A5027E